MSNWRKLSRLSAEFWNFEPRYLWAEISAFKVVKINNYQTLLRHTNFCRIYCVSSSTKNGTLPIYFLQRSTCHPLLLFFLYGAGAHQNSSVIQTRGNERRKNGSRRYLREKRLLSLYPLHSSSIQWQFVGLPSRCNATITIPQGIHKSLCLMYIALLDLLLTFKSILLCPLNFKDVISKTF